MKTRDEIIENINKNVNLFIHFRKEKDKCEPLANAELAVLWQAKGMIFCLGDEFGKENDDKFREVVKEYHTSGSEQLSDSDK